MFDDFDGSDHVESLGEIAVEVGIVEIELHEFRFQLEVIFQVRRSDMKSHHLQALRERSAAGSEIEDARAGHRIAPRNFHDSLMRAGKSSYQTRGMLSTILGIAGIVASCQRAITS